MYLFFSHLTSISTPKHVQLLQHVCYLLHYAFCSVQMSRPSAFQNVWQCWKVATSIWGTVIFIPKNRLLWLDSCTRHKLNLLKLINFSAFISTLRVSWEYQIWNTVAKYPKSTTFSCGQRYHCLPAACSPVHTPILMLAFNRLFPAKSHEQVDHSVVPSYRPNWGRPLQYIDHQTSVSSCWSRCLTF